MTTSLPVCEKCNSRKKSCQQYHLLYEDKIQIVKEITNSLPFEEENMASHQIDGLGLSPTSSLANIGLSQISLPLAWKTKETRTFSMFLVFQTRNKVIDTKIISHVDRNMTDVVIPDTFIFDNEPENFSLDILIYAVRTDYGLNNINENGGSLRSRISRSLGRRFGATVKNQSAQQEVKKTSIYDQTIGGNHYNLLAKATLTITDASEEATIHNLRMSAFADLSGPPLYGHIICRMAIQPHSVLRPIAEGVLSIHHVSQDIELENYFARLQGGHLVFYTIGDIANKSMENILEIPLNRRSRIISTYPNFTFLLNTDETSDVPASVVYLTANTEKAFDTWRRAIEIQIYDIGVWGKFATRSTNLLYQKREDPLKETLSRAVGSNLYETISIKGSISKFNFGGLSILPSEKSELLGAATAPVKRTKARTNVIDIFHSVSPKTEPKEQHSPQQSKYVIQLNIGESPPENEYSAYSPLYSVNSNKSASRLQVRNNEDPKIDGKKSWSKSIGSIMNRSNSHITRL